MGDQHSELSPPIADMVQSENFVTKELHETGDAVAWKEKLTYSSTNYGGRVQVKQMIRYLLHTVPALV